MTQAPALSFQHRILLLVTTLLVLGVGGLVLAMVAWVRIRSEEDIHYRLGLAASVLRRIHDEESVLRVRRFESLAAEPRYLALAQVMEMKESEPTLQEQVEEHDLSKRGWAGVGFSSGQGKLLAWRGPARAAVAAELPGLLKPGAAPALLVLEGKPLELLAIGLHAPATPEKIAGFLVVLIPFQSAVLDEFAIVVGGALELRADGVKIAASRNAEGLLGEIRSVEVPLSKTASFRFLLGVDQVSEPLRAMLRTMSLIAAAVVLLGSGASFAVARRMSKPLGRLTAAARSVAGGSLSVRVDETGAPELRILARNFNEMVDSLSRSREKLKAHANDLLEVSERERRRFAQDLHDGLGQDLAGIALHCQALEKRLESVPGGPDARRIAELVHRAIDKARSLSRGLSPSGLERDDLEAALREMASFIQQTFSVACVVDWDPRVSLGDRGTATHLYWIAQEAATNAVRHAKPRTLWVRTAAGDDRQIRLTVRDDGQGMATGSESKGGMGLRTMRSRAEMIGGTLEVRPHPEGGTIVVCELPGKIPNI